MGNKKITDLPSATAVNAGDKVEIVQGGTSKQVDANLLSGSGLSGLTTNKVLKATSSTTAGDSNITDDVNGVIIVSPAVTSSLNVTDTQNQLAWSDTKNGNVTLNNTKTNIVHDDLINLAAPSVTKGGVEVATVNDIPTVDTTIIDGSTNAVSGNAVFDGLAIKANNLIYKINTPITHTGTTAETILNPSTFLSGFEANDFLMIDLRFALNNNANTKTVRVYVNTSHSLVGATQIATMAGSSNVSGYLWLTRELQFNNSLSSTNVFSPTINFTTDQSAISNTAPTTLTFDFTSGCYFIITGILNASAADTITIRGLKLRLNR